VNTANFFRSNRDATMIVVIVVLALIVVYFCTAWVANGGSSCGWGHGGSLAGTHTAAGTSRSTHGVRRLRQLTPPKTALLPGHRYKVRMPLVRSGLPKQPKKTKPLNGRGPAVPGRVRFSPVILVQEIESCLA
jgi:hypothetical protein